MHHHACHAQACLPPRSLTHRRCTGTGASQGASVCASGADFYDSDDEVLADQEHGLRGAKVSKAGTASIIHSYAEARQPVSVCAGQRVCVCVRVCVRTCVCMCTCTYVLLVCARVCAPAGEWGHLWGTRLRAWGVVRRVQC
jgi:hypothetical protein